MIIDTEKLLNEADVLIGLNMFDQAIAKYDHIIQHAPECDDAWLMRGAVKGQTGQVDAAISDIERSISIDDSNASAFLTLAYLYERKKDDFRALELCQRSVEISVNEDAIKLLVHLCTKFGNLMLSSSQYDKAESYFNRALEYRKDDAALIYRMVLVLRGKGKIEESVKLAEKVVSIDPGHVRARTHIASSCELLGEIEKGLPIIEDLMASHPDHPMVNIVYAHYALRNKNQQAGISALNRIITQDDIQEYDLITALMFLGKLHDSISEFDQAFKFYKQANVIMDKGYDPLSYSNYVTSLINYFSKEKYDEIPVSENISDEVIFIVGMPRSGTSLVEQIVSAHSSVHGAGELTYVNNLVDRLQATLKSVNIYPLCIEQADVDIMTVLADGLVSDIRTEGGNGLKISDKLPHNFLHIALIHKLLPKAKIINCFRDPRDTCLSCYFQYFAGYHPYANNLRSLGMHYNDYLRLMDHWVKVLHIPVLSVNYESLVADTEGEVRRIIEYLDLPWEDGCLEFYKSRRTVATASYDQVNKKIYTGSVGRWKNYEAHLESLLTVLDE